MPHALLVSFYSRMQDLFFVNTTIYSFHRHRPPCIVCVCTKHKQYRYLSTLMLLFGDFSYIVTCQLPCITILLIKQNTETTHSTHSSSCTMLTAWPNVNQNQEKMRNLFKWFSAWTHSKQIILTLQNPLKDCLVSPWAVVSLRIAAGHWCTYPKTDQSGEILLIEKENLQLLDCLGIIWTLISHKETFSELHRSYTQIVFISPDLSCLPFL